MTRLVGILVMALFAATAGTSYGAGQSAGELVAAMRQVRHSDGFAARMSITVVKPDGEFAGPFRVAVIGQVGDTRQRLLVRGIAPREVHNWFVAAERTVDGRMRAVSYTNTPAGGTVKFDPAAPLFGSGLVLWDMLEPWWNWRKQDLVEPAEVSGRPCTVVRSQTDERDAAIREVVSCVDPEARLALRTQLFDRQHAPGRTITVERMVRLESGARAVKKLTITDADKSVTEVEVYSGDEHYLVTPATFAALDASPENQ